MWEGKMVEGTSGWPIYYNIYMYHEIFSYNFPETTKPTRSTLRDSKTLQPSLHMHV